MSEPKLSARLGAEALGTFWLVFGGCGSAVLAAKFLVDPDNTQVGIGFLGVALAFGLTVLTGVYAFGHVSGGHFNPAVSIGLAVAKRFDWKLVGPYVITQIVAGTIAAGVLFVVASGKAGVGATAVRLSGFATNGYGALPGNFGSPGDFGLLSCLLIEVVLTAIFVLVILGATDSRAPKGFAGLAIGLTLTIIHLVAIPVTNTSVNPARSLAVAFFVGGPPLAQVWLFIVAPIIGAAIAGATYALITGAKHPVDEGIANNPEIGTAPLATD